MQDLPKLKFIIDPNNDFEIYKGFLATAKVFKETKKYIEMFFYNLYPGLEKINKKNKLIKIFIGNEYKKDKVKINTVTRKTKEKWQIAQKNFFKETSLIFKNHPWPKGEYVAYPTIWGTFPRFLKNKTFTFPYKKISNNFVLFVFMHEMMHFIFYDYVVKKYPKIFKKLDTESGIFWDMAEIFNTIILDQPKYKKLHKYKKAYCYPQHKKHIPKLKKNWEKEPDLDKWLIKTYKILK